MNTPKATENALVRLLPSLSRTFFFDEFFEAFLPEIINEISWNDIK